MIDGIYKGYIDSPMGRINGNVKLKTDNQDLSGELEAMGTRNVFTNGKVNGNSCEFSGTIRYLFVNISYQAKGTIEAGKLDIDAHTNKGIFKIIGTKVD